MPATWRDLLEELAPAFRRACWFFSGAVWDSDELGLAVARLAVRYLLAEGDPLVAASDSTFFRRWGRKVPGPAGL